MCVCVHARAVHMCLCARVCGHVCVCACVCVCSCAHAHVQLRAVCRILWMRSGRKKLQPLCAWSSTSHVGKTQSEEHRFDLINPAGISSLTVQLIQIKCLHSNFRVCVSVCVCVCVCVCVWKC